MSQEAPPQARRLLEERAAARDASDWSRADALRDQLRALGWEPVDGPAGSTLRPALPGGETETGYARPEDLRSRLDEPAILQASLVIGVEEEMGDLERLAAGLRRHRPEVGWELVAVANGTRAATVERLLEDLPVELVVSRARLGWAEAMNLGMRGARGAAIVILDTSVEPVGDFLPGLLRAFDDQSVGLTGPWGVTSPDARHFDDAPPGEVDAVLAYCLAVRRQALAAVRGFDQRFRWYRHADLDLSFAIRDAGWRAVATDPLPLVRHAHRGYTDLGPEERERLSRRNFYRFLDHWRSRPDLLVRPTAPEPGGGRHR